MDYLSSVLACCKRGEHDHDGDAAVDCCNVLWHGKSSKRWETPCRSERALSFEMLAELHGVLCVAADVYF